MEVLPELVHVHHDAVLALPLGSRLLLLLLLGLQPLLASTGPALLLLPLSHFCTSFLGDGRAWLIGRTGHLWAARQAVMYCGAAWCHCTASREEKGTFAWAAR